MKRKHATKCRQCKYDFARLQWTKKPRAEAPQRLQSRTDFRWFRANVSPSEPSSTNWGGDEL